jgi:hypothetical protein
LSIDNWPKIKGVKAAGACVCLVPLAIQITELHALKKGSNCLNTCIYSYLETSGSQSFNPYLNVVHFFNTSVN